MNKSEIIEGQNLITLVNAVELATAIIEAIGGNDISTVVDGKPVTPTESSSALAAKFQSKFIKNRGV